MPIYEFQCNECLTVFEEILLLRDEMVICRCGSSNVKQLMSRPAPARIVDFKRDKDKGIGFELSDATFDRSVKDPVPWSKTPKVYEMDFGPAEKRKLNEIAQSMKE